MKKVLVVLIIAIFIISGCSGGSETQSSNATSNEPIQQVENDKDESTNKDENNSESDGKLTQVGQKVKSADATTELLKIKELNETIQHGPLNISLIDAKLLKQTDLSSSYKSYIRQFVPIEDELIYLQLQYSVENTIEDNVYWTGLKYLTTDLKEQIDVRLLDLNSFNENDFYGNVENDYLHGIALSKPEANSIKLIFGPVNTNDDNFDELAGEVEYEFSFE